MRTDLGDKVYAVLRQHTGEAEAISSRQICRELRWPLSRERLVRRLIKDESPLWSKEGQQLPVCSVPGRGFFVAASIDEAVARYNWLHDLAVEAGRTRDDFATICTGLGLNVRTARRILTS